VVIIGAGPAGLTAAYELSKSGLKSVILEKDEVVGGLARTTEHKGYLFDIGGHRFFTKVPLVQELWEQVLGDDLLRRPRLSRIYYKSKFFAYPLEPLGALRGLGPVEAIRCALSYARARLLPRRPEEDFETWVSNRFGRRLFEIFFQSYTEKVWGMPCNEIRSEWAAQRIQDVSLTSLLRYALCPTPKAARRGEVKSLIGEFLYPRKGPGMMWSRLREMVEADGARVVLRSPVESIRWEPGRVLGVRAGGQYYGGSHFLSSMPIRELWLGLDPAPPPHVLRAADDFHYRDFLTVALIVKGKDLFRDNWIYIHDPSVAVGRIQNYNNWSPDMVPTGDTTCLGLEYFCKAGDGLWRLTDAQLIERASEEAARVGLVRTEDVIDGAVLRVEKAYPVYDDTYQRGLEVVREFLRDLPNLQLIGRNGMHRYNNQDHAMLTGILAARNIMGARYDLWQVNADFEYHEQDNLLNRSHLQAMESAQPLVPQRLPSPM
jgi:protoporphyrinogen oxidase